MALEAQARAIEVGHHGCVENARVWHHVHGGDQADTTWQPPRALLIARHRGARHDYMLSRQLPRRQQSPIWFALDGG